MKKYTEEEIKEHLRAEEHYLRTGKGEDIESRSNHDGQWRRFGTNGIICLSRFKPAPKIVPFDVTDAPIGVQIRGRNPNIVGAKPVAIVICKGYYEIVFSNVEGGMIKSSYDQALNDLEFTLDGVTWQPYGRKEG